MGCFFRYNGHTKSNPGSDRRIRQKARNRTKKKAKQDPIVITWAGIFEHAVITLGINPKDFYKLTLYEYRCLTHRYFFQNARDWSHTRYISYTIFSVNSAKKVPLDEYLPLLIDSESTEKKEDITPERQSELRDIANQRLRILNQRNFK